jgi:hypothetical protein
LVRHCRRATSAPIVPPASTRGLELLSAPTAWPASSRARKHKRVHVNRKTMFQRHLGHVAHTCLDILQTIILIVMMMESVIYPVNNVRRTHNAQVTRLLAATA